MIENIRMKEDILTGKNILVVDDDVRNLFALTTVFERYNINVITAESGKEAINIINEDNPKIDMVLMDIMMPEMDGYETTQKIRREHKNSTLADHCRNGKSDERRPAEMYRSGRIGLYYQAIENRSVAFLDAGLVL